jgi:flagellar biosynthesis protein FliR
LNVFNITMSLKSVVGLAVLVLALPLIAERAGAGLVEMGRLVQAVMRMGP